MKSIGKVVVKVFEICTKSGIGGAAAELSFYMIFLIFPLAFTVGRVLEIVGCDLENTVLFHSLVPREISGLFADFIDNRGGFEESESGVWQAENRAALIGAFLCVRTGAKYVISAGKRLEACAVNAGFAPRKMQAEWGILPALAGGFLHRWVVAAAHFFVTVAAGVVTVIFSLVGRRFYELLPPELFPLRELFARTRFVFVFAVAWTALTWIYRSCAAFPQVRGAVGKAVASLMWMTASAAFSYYIEGYWNHRRIYGPAATATVLLLWLFLTNAIILFGAAMNLALCANNGKSKDNGNVQE